MYMNESNEVGVHGSAAVPAARPVVLSVVQRLEVLPPPPQAGHRPVKGAATLLAIPVESIPIFYKLQQHAAVLLVGDVAQYLAYERQVGVGEPDRESRIGEEIFVRLEGVLLRVQGRAGREVCVGGGVGVFGGAGAGRNVNVGVFRGRGRGGM